MGWREGLFGNDEGEGPQWGWVNKVDDFLDRRSGRDEMSEVEQAIAHNEVRGDPIPDGWYVAAEAGVQTFTEAADGDYLGDLNDFTNDPRQEHDPGTFGNKIGW